MHLSSTKFKIVKLLSSQSLRLCIALLFGTTAAAQNTDLRLEYDEPAKLLVEALPVGSGRLGGMIYGNPTAMIIHKP